jgi:hypothetical protein
MAESKFDKLFEQREAEPPAAVVPEPEREKAAPRRRVRVERQPPPTARPLGRPPGKRSDPAWKQFSVLLKRDTQREAAAILRAKDEGLDLSGLVQTLLESWIQRQNS